MIRKIIVYWYQFSKIKKTDPDRSPTRCRPRRLSLGCAVREEPPSPCARRRSCHQGRQWSPSPCAVEEACSRSVSSTSALVDPHRSASSHHRRPLSTPLPSSEMAERRPTLLGLSRLDGGGLGAVPGSMAAPFSTRRSFPRYQSAWIKVDRRLEGGATVDEDGVAAAKVSL
jgi:hypothetical protein